MPEFRADEWTRKKGAISFSVTARHYVDVWVSCTKIVQVFGVREGEKVLLKAGTEFRFRGPLKGFQKVEVTGTGETPFGLKVRETALQDGEPNDGEKPPVVTMPEPGNLVLKMRQIAQAHHSQSRMPVLEPEDGPSLFWYELEDEDEVEFEEELIERLENEKAAKAAKEKEEKAAFEAARQEAKEKAALAAPDPANGEGAPPPAEPAKAAE